jgi:hypothetical protein
MRVKKVATNDDEKLEQIRRESSKRWLLSDVVG